MPERPEPTAWLTRRPGLTALAALSGVLVLLVFLPYLQFVLLGVVLAYITFPLQQRTEQYVRPTVAAVATVVAVLVLILLPVGYLLWVAVRQSLVAVRDLRNGQLDITAVEQLLESTGYSVDLGALYASNQERIAAAIETVTASLLGFAGSLPGLFIGLTITLFVLFALLRDGEALVAWIRWVLPVEQDILDEIHQGVDQLMWASIVGNVAVAAIQAVLLGIGLAIAGLPLVVFLTVATFVLTLLPLVGAFGVWIPACIYLVAVGRPVAGGAVFVYGLVISFSDVYLRPALIGRSSALNSAIVVVGIFGGLATFGAVGLFVGPVVVGGTKVVFDCFARTHTGESVL